MSERIPVNRPRGDQGATTEERAIKLDVQPANPEQFARLIDFTRELFGVCDSLEIEPVASGSLVVLLYTKDPAIEVHDIDLSCSENDFPRLLAALVSRGIAAAVTDWHVLQARRDDLKVEFDSREYWMKDLPEDDATAEVADLQMKVVSRDSLVELYRRGLEATAESGESANGQKQQSIRDKLTRLARQRRAAGEVSEPKWALRPARADDQDFLFSLNETTTREQIERVWGWDDAEQAQSFRERFQPEGWQVIQADGQDVGVLIVREDDDQIYLAEIQIRPGWQGRGIGSSIIRSLMESATQARKPLTLRVLHVNARARTLYDQLGFRPFKETETFTYLEWIPSQP